MKRRQAKKVIKRWPAQRHDTLRRAVRVCSRVSPYGLDLSATRRVICALRESGWWQLSLWLARRAEARWISTLHNLEPREDVAEMWSWVYSTERLFLVVRREVAYGT